MDTVQDQAAARLYKKLSALRVTLPNDERDVFDQIIPAEDEVTAHRFQKKALKRTKKAPEVTAHRITKAKATKKATKKVTKKATK